jgi:hypothetical protein
VIKNCTAPVAALKSKVKLIRSFLVSPTAVYKLAYSAGEGSLPELQALELEDRLF